MLTENLISLLSLKFRCVKNLSFVLTVYIIAGNMTYTKCADAFLLSSDLSTLFTGLFIEITVYPFSFSEYCEYYGYNSNTANEVLGMIREGETLLLKHRGLNSRSG